MPLLVFHKPESLVAVLKKRGARGWFHNVNEDQWECQMSGVAITVRPNQVSIVHHAAGPRSLKWANKWIKLVLEHVVGRGAYSATDSTRRQMMKEVFESEDPSHNAAVEVDGYTLAYLKVTGSLLGFNILKIEEDNTNARK